MRRRPHVLAPAVATLTFAGLALLAGCAGDGDGDTEPPALPTPTDPAITEPGEPEPEPTEPPDTDPETTEPDPTDPDPTEPAVTEPAVTEPPATMGDPSIELVEVTRLDRPVGLATRRGDPAVYVVEQDGRVIAVDPASGGTVVVLDVSDLTSAQGERGLLGLAFHPGGDRAYVNSTDRADDTTVVAEYAVGVDGVFDPQTRRVVLEIEQPFGNHNGGHLTFGPDGHLYIGMGDGGSAGDPLRASLDLGTPLGKLLRIDPTPGPERPYTIPDDNPFVDVDGAAPEIFSIGLRNPWKFEFDRLTGDLWIADVGQNEQEEINHVPADGGAPAGAGLSFGWSAFEGTLRFNEDQDPDGHVDPVFTYQTGVEGCSISGGTPYRGEEIPALQGGYVYSDYCSGTIWAFDVATGRNLTLGQATSVTSVLPGPGGELFVTSHAGPLLRIVTAG